MWLLQVFNICFNRNAFVIEINTILECFSVPVP